MDSEDSSFWTPFFIIFMAIVLVAEVRLMVRREPPRSTDVVVSFSRSGSVVESKVPEVPLSPMERRKVIAVIDTGIDPNHPDLKPFLCVGGHRDFVGTGLYDTHGHGTHIAGLIVKGLDPKAYCVMALKYYDNQGMGYLNLVHEVQALAWARKQHAYLVNFSGGGEDKSESETAEVKALLAQGTIFVTCAGNEGKELGSGKWGSYCYYPACSTKHPNFHVAGSLNKVGVKLPSSNFGTIVTDWAPGLMQLSTLPDGKYGTMSGTSQACANTSNRLLGGKGESWTSP